MKKAESTANCERESPKDWVVVMYRTGEASDKVTGRDRWDWDLKNCQNQFAALNLWKFNFAHV